MSAAPGDGRAPLVVVLGASGYIGSAVVAQLARRPVRLRLVSRRPAAPPAARGAVVGRATVEQVVADLAVPGAAARAVAGADAVLDLVAHLDPAVGWRAVEGGGEELGERLGAGLVREIAGALRAGRRPAAAPPPLVVLAGSASQAGRGGGVVDGTGPDRPATVYARQKLAAEKELLAAGAEGVLRGVSLRLPTVYGSGPGPDGHGVVAAMARRALAGEPLTVWGTGSVVRDLLHVTDAAAAFTACLDHGAELAGRHWPVGTGRPVPVRELFTALARAVAERTGRPAVPVTSVAPPAAATAADAAGTVVDATAFRAATGWRPRRELPEALAELAAALADRSL
ncbi:NAD-dependent epimerase/dehydratase family protein [Kitasatospora sp. CM 4170]|uniref:NAD-dependent epimerase/dehydratase family protein n=1 Tax=Kitasatospora aburaviensis TaxID=67265 RepID=A0ABW1ERL4_9ACTN|nr:NAD-dependent epimerase/dehydratase family protein [Kitasatospora sp. CM 4170]WNM44422.1 NAD-dependent epimerase/dehydratase family protein [Kitasatospora sp. CM 4170]